MPMKSFARQSVSRPGGSLRLWPSARPRHFQENKHFATAHYVPAAFVSVAALLRRRVRLAGCVMNVEGGAPDRSWRGARAAFDRALVTAREMASDCALAGRFEFVAQHFASPWNGYSPRCGARAGLLTVGLKVKTRQEKPDQVLKAWIVSLPPIASNE